MIGNYWNSAWRNLMKRKRFSFINIFGLAIGMASALLILTYVTFEFSFDKMHTKYDHIYRCLLYTSPSPRDRTRSRMPSSA